MSKVKQRLSLLLNPWAIIGSIALGALVGTFLPKFAFAIAPYGKLYLSLLQMSVLPLIICGVISGLGNLLKEGEAAVSIGKIMMIFAIGVAATSAVILIVVSIIKPGAGLGSEARELLGTLLSKSDSAAKGAGDLELQIDLGNFFLMMIPQNPFAAVTEGKNLPVVFISLLFGLALGASQSEAAKTAVTVASGLFDTFLRIINWVLFGLPLGLFCLFAGQFIDLGFGVFLALGKLIVTIYLCGAIMMVGYALLLAWSLRRPPHKAWLGLRETILVAIGTSSSFATIPVAMVDLERNFGIKRDTTNLIMPLALTFNPQGTMVYFLTASLFMANLYGVSLGFGEMIFAAVASLFASIAISGVPAVVGLSVLSIVLQPLGLPTEAAVILLLAVNPILDPLATIVNITAHSTAAAIAGQHRTS